MPGEQKQPLSADDPMRTTLTEIEAQWEEVAANLIADTLAANPSERFYAAAFWLFALDGQSISPPAFAINAESGISPVDSYGEDNRWNPADWPVSVNMAAYDEMTPAYFKLSDQLTGKDWAVWEQVDELQKQAIARVCRRLTSRIRMGKPPFDHLPAHPDFIVGIFDGRDGPEETVRLLRASIDSAILEEIKDQLWELK